MLEENENYIHGYGYKLVNDTIKGFKQECEAKEQLRKAEENEKEAYENLLKIIKYLDNRLDNEKFKNKIITDTCLKNLIIELRTKICNLNIN